jgi:outer membrane protein assembly factor BamA
MHPRVPFLVALLVLGTAAASPAQAPPAASSVDPFLGKPIAEVRLVLDGREIRDAEVSRVLETVVGAALTTAGVRESIVHLMAMVRFEDVTAEAELTPAGVTLVYTLVPLHAVKSIEFRGDLGLSARLLRAAVEERYTVSPPVSRAEEIAALLEALCHDHGFLKAVVQPSTEVTHNPDRTRLIFEMAAGPPARIGSTSVEGAPDGNAAQVLSRLGLVAGARFDRLALEAAVARYVEDLRAKGFLEAKVNPDIVFSPSREQADITVRMARGPQVSVTFRGDALPDKRRAELTSQLRARPLDEDVLENEEQSIRNDLLSSGYRDASARFTREVRGENQLQIVFTVARGPQYRVVGVELAGHQQLPRD